jgi:hypothetical protein
VWVYCAYRPAEQTNYTFTKRCPQGSPPLSPGQGFYARHNKRCFMSWKNTACFMPIDGCGRHGFHRLPFLHSAAANPSSLAMKKHKGTPNCKQSSEISVSLIPCFIQINKCTFPRPPARPQDAHILAFAVCSAARPKLLHSDAQSIRI